MYQVNFLSSDVSQTLDVSGGKGDVSNKNQTKGNAFSDAMEQHYPKKNNTDSESKNNQGGNLVSKAAEQQPPAKWSPTLREHAVYSSQHRANQHATQL